MNITKQEYVNLCYAIAKEKGFYNKLENQSIAGNIVHIGSELGEVFEAHRNGYFFELKDFSVFENIQPKIIDDCELTKELVFYAEYNSYIKNRFEDELADVLIRSFSMCGYFNLNHESSTYNETLKLLDYSNTIPDKLCLLNEQLFTIRLFKGGIDKFIQSVEKFCSQVDVDIYKFVDLKIEYNKTRLYLNGKKY